MRRHFTSFFCNVALSLGHRLLRPKKSRLTHDDLTLLADFIEAEDASGPVALITHGTLAHKDMELVESLQESLAEQALAPSRIRFRSILMRGVGCMTALLRIRIKTKTPTLKSSHGLSGCAHRATNKSH